MKSKVFVAVAAMLFGGAAQAATIINGSFEIGAFTEGYPGIVAGDTAITGWTVGLGGVNWGGDQMWVASDGTHSIDMSRSSPGSLSQTIMTTIDQSYTVSFDLAGNPGGGGIRSMSVDVGAGTAQTYEYDTTGRSPSDMGWIGQTYSFTATSSSTTLTFTGLTPGASGAALDNVAISKVGDVPEPTSWAMMLGGFGMIGWATRRRQVQQFA